MIFLRLKADKGVAKFENKLDQRAVIMSQNLVALTLTIAETQLFTRTDRQTVGQVYVYLLVSEMSPSATIAYKQSLITWPRLQSLIVISPSISDTYEGIHQKCRHLCELS